MFPPPPLFAFGFANPAMLAWLAAAAAPILIHLWSRRKRREMAWAAMAYLLAAVERRGRRLRLEQWLLAALRTALIVLVVFAAAGPSLDCGAAAQSRGPTHHVLVIDGSYSMAYRPGDKSLFARAKELAARIVAASPRGDAFSLVLMASPPRVVLGPPTFEATVVRRELDNLELTHAGADLPAAVAAVNGLLEKTGGEGARLQRREVCFLSDLQRATWFPELDAAAMREFRRQSQALSQAASLVVIDLGQPNAENAAVSDVRAADPLAVAGQPFRIEATLKNFGRQSRAAQTVELLVEGRRQAAKTVDLPAGGEAAVAFRYWPEAAGDLAVEVRAEGDALDIDNHRYMVVPVRQTIRALCIDGRPSGEPFRGATGYLAAALAPAGRPGRVAVETAAESAILERDLGGCDCVFLCDVAQFTASEARALDAHLGHGGSLVFFLGPQVLADRYNRELTGESGRPRILPARLGATVEDASAGIDPLGFRHPIVRAFEGNAKSGLLTMPIGKRCRLELPPNSTANVVLAAADGQPLIVEQSIRQGRVVLVATSADLSWTAMPLWPSYVPLVQEILAWCAGGKAGRRNLEVGQPLRGSVSAAGGDAATWLTLPDGQTRQIPLRAEGDYAAWSYGDTTQSGVYTARVGSPSARGESFAVNVDVRESDLARSAPEELKSAVWPQTPFLYRTTWDEAVAGDAAPLARSQRLGVGLLYAAFALLCGETFLAWRFGHRDA